MRKKEHLLTVAAIAVFAAFFWACASPKPAPVRTVITPVPTKPVDQKTSQ